MSYCCLVIEKKGHLKELIYNTFSYFGHEQNYPDGNLKIV